jgi:hypothetical protein
MKYIVNIITIISIKIIDVYKYFCYYRFVSSKTKTYLTCRAGGLARMALFSNGERSVKPVCGKR